MTTNGILVVVASPAATLALFCPLCPRLQLIWKRRGKLARLAGFADIHVDDIYVLFSAQFGYLVAEAFAGSRCSPFSSLKPPFKLCHGVAPPYGPRPYHSALFSMKSTPLRLTVRAFINLGLPFFLSLIASNTSRMSPMSCPSMSKVSKPKSAPFFNHVQTRHDSLSQVRPAGGRCCPRSLRNYRAYFVGGIMASSIPSSIRRRPLSQNTVIPAVPFACQRHAHSGRSALSKGTGGDVDTGTFLHVRMAPEE